MGSRAQAAEIDLDLHSRPSGDQTRLPYVSLAQIRWAVPEIFHTQTKKSQHQKQNLAQFTACGKTTQGQRSKHWTRKFNRDCQPSLPVDGRYWF